MSPVPANDLKLAYELSSVAQRSVVVFANCFASVRSLLIPSLRESVDVFSLTLSVHYETTRALDIVEEFTGPRGTKAAMYPWDVIK